MRWRDSIAQMLPAHARESGIVFTGDVLSKFLTFVITMMLMKLVTPSEYALYGVFIAVLATVNQFTDSGLQTSLIRFQALYQNLDPGRASSHLRFAWNVKWIILLGTGAAMLLAARPLALSAFQNAALEYPFRLLSLGIIGNGLYEFMQAVFQARQKFGTLSVLRISEGGGKLLFILVFLAAGSFSLDVVFIAYVLVPGIVGLAGVLLARRLWVRMRDDWRVIGLEIFGFGKWMMLSSFATMLLMRLDIFVLGAMLHEQPDEIGLYSAAVRLCTPLIVLTGSVATLFLPKALGLRSMPEMRSYIRRSLQVTLPLIALCAVYALAVCLAVPAYFPKYASAIPYFLVLFVGYAWTIVGNPLTTLVLSINRAHVVTIISIAQLFLTTASHYVFIGWMGSMGAAISTVVMWFLAGGVSLSYLYRHRHEIESSGGSAAS